ncbi:MAG: sulfatase [Candidatus Binatia bacterium]|nr:sulfatase [Candidatus Binatia bacterium]
MASGLANLSLRIGVLLAVLGAVMIAIRPTTPSGPMNVVIVVSDSLRAENLQAYGYGKPTTPFLASLGDSSIVYENAFSHYSFTWPSISNLFTGLPYSTLVSKRLFTQPTGKNGFRWKGGLVDRATTLAERLDQVGVRSYGVSASPYVSKRTGFDQGFRRFFSWDDWKRLRQRRRPPYVPAGEVNAIATDFLRELSAPKRQPWLLYLHYMDTHMAYRAKPRDLAKFGDPDYDRKDRVKQGAALKPDGKWLKWRTEDLEDWFGEEDVDELVAHYDGQIRRFDRAMGELFAELDRTGLRDDTIVILTSDHGEGLFERGFWGHGYLSRSEEQHIPLIVLFPPGTHEPERAAFPVTTTDIYHTLLTHFGAKAGDGPALPQVADLFAASPNREVAYTEGPGGTRVYRDGRFVLYQHRNTSKKKYLLPAPDGDFLFDVSVDPGENRNLLASGGASAITVRDRLLAAGPSSLVAATSPDPMLEAKGKLRESLRALGYVED